jgi:hypothetical protein
VRSIFPMMAPQAGDKFSTSIDSYNIVFLSKSSVKNLSKIKTK